MESKSSTRVIQINPLIGNQSLPNYIQTAKYTVYNFLPLCLLNQFRSYFNVFFLVTIVINSIELISPVNPLSEAMPFIVVIVIAICREGYEDYKKLQYDRAYNNSLSLRYDYSTNSFESIQWKSISMGHVIKVKQNEVIPADLVILKSSNANGFSYIQTTDLDGETNLKPREALSLCQVLLGNEERISSVINGFFEEELPNKNIYVVDGCLRLDNQTDIYFNKANCLLRNGILRNAEYIIGLVIYTGKETKIMQNINKEPQKLSQIDLLLNKTIFILILLDLCLCGILTGIGISFAEDNRAHEGSLKMDYLFYKRANEEHSSLALEVVRTLASYFNIFSLLIPISILVTLELCKTIQTVVLYQDASFRQGEGEKTRYFSMKLHENLGAVKYIFTDKTGTLTRNEMEFKGCSIFTKLFSETQGVFTATDCDTGCSSFRQRTIFSKSFNRFALGEALITNSKLLISDHESNQTLREMALEFFTNIAINHNVLVSTEAQSKSSYSGSNPDEIVLVQAAKEIGIEFIERVGSSCSIELFNEVVEYEILHSFEFTSERKRSSIIVRNSSGVIKLFMKGADSVILGKLNAFSKENILPQTQEHIDLFSKEGLRTLCFSSKIIEEEEYNTWLTAYTELQGKALKNKQFIPALNEHIALLEDNMLLLGVSALEDLLQDEVANSITDFLDAEINVWMLTGDKLDTAQSIGNSCKLICDESNIYKINEVDADKTNQFLQKIKRDIDNNSTKAESMKPKRDWFKHFKVKQPALAARRSSVSNDKMLSPNMLSYPKSKKKEEEGKRFTTDHNKEMDKIEEHRLPNDYSILTYMVNKDIIMKNDNEVSLTFVNNIKKNQDKDISIKVVKTINPRCDFNKIQNNLERKMGNFAKNDHLLLINDAKTGHFLNPKQEKDNDKDNIALRNFALIIEGAAITQCLNEENRKIFYECASQCRSVICSRCSPGQKAEIVKCIKSQSQHLTLSIGDGGNDVNMLKSADIGIGIFGKEGSQAAYSSDFAFSQFKYLKQFLFTHGRYSIQRNSYFVYYSFFKNIITAFIQFWFTIYSGFSGTIFFDTLYMLGFNSFLTVILPCVYSIFEEDIDVSFEKHSKKEMAKILLTNLYKEMRNNRPLSVKLFSFYILIAFLFSVSFFFFPMASFSYGIVDKGQACSLADQSLSTIISVILFIYTIIFTDTYYFNKWVTGFFIFQFVLSIGFVFVQNYIPGSLVAELFFDIASTKFWAVTFLNYGLNLTVFYSVTSLRRFFFQDIVNRIRNNTFMVDIQKDLFKRKRQEANKYSQSLEKFKKIYRQRKKFKPDSYFEKRLNDCVEEFRSHRSQKKLLSVKSPCKYNK